MQWLLDLPQCLSGYVMSGTTSILNGLTFQSAQGVHIPKPFEFADFARVYRASPYVKLAGLSGALAVFLNAYYSHKMNRTEEQKRAVFATGLQQHFYHTLALLAVPFVKHDRLAGTMFITGILLFCGTCYGTSALDQKHIQSIAPAGGLAFIIGWLSMIL